MSSTPQADAVALERGDTLPLLLAHTGGRWVIADDDDLPAAKALERGKGQ